jgi:hypothetical protein
MYRLELAPMCAHKHVHHILQLYFSSFLLKNILNPREYRLKKKLLESCKVDTDKPLQENMPGRSQVSG